MPKKADKMGNARMQTATRPACPCGHDAWKSLIAVFKLSFGSTSSLLYKLSEEAGSAQLLLAETSSLFTSTSKRQSVFENLSRSSVASNSLTSVRCLRESTAGSTKT